MKSECRINAAHGASFILVGLVDVFDTHYSQVAVISEVTECDSCPRLDLKVGDFIVRDIEADGHAEEIPVDETFLLNDAVCEG